MLYMKQFLKKSLERLLLFIFMLFCLGYYIFIFTMHEKHIDRKVHFKCC